MKSAIVFCFVALCAVASTHPHDSREHYNSQYDSINIDEILHNEKLLLSYYKCIMDEGKCTSQGKELKSHIPDALQTKCSKCTEVQSKGVEKVIKYLTNNKPELWKKLLDKYDPDRKFSAQYEEDVKKAKSA